MVLNPTLFAALSTFGKVNVLRPSIPFSPRVELNHHGKPSVVCDRNAEHYILCCPLCGDTRFRLNINHGWLTTPFSGLPPVTHVAYCHNENCPVTGLSFILEVRKRMLARGGLSVAAPSPAKPAVLPTQLRLPRGLIPLDQLPEDHPAITFLRTKYNGLPAGYLARNYDAAWASEYDELYRLVKGRIIFPIYEQWKLVGWQGRRTDGDSDRRWILPPGFRKVFYNGDRVRADQIPIICEGITSSIACGPTAIAIFGKDLSEDRSADFAKRWKSAVVALDPETFVPDLRTQHKQSGHDAAPARVYAAELIARLNKFCSIPVRSIQWPDDVLALARRKVAGEDVKVPDAADLGIVRMNQLLSES